MSKTIYLGEVYRDTISITKLAIENGLIKESKDVIPFIESTYDKLLKVREASEPYDQASQIADRF